MAFPLELVYQVMSSLLPDDDDTFIPPSHGTTQLLLAFSSVSKGVHKEAVILMRRHCMYIDSNDRLIRFLRCLQASRESTTGLPNIFNDIDKLCLIPRNPMDSLDRFDDSNVDELFLHVMWSLRRLVVNLKGTGAPPNFNSLVQLEELVCSSADLEVAAFQQGVDGNVDTRVNPWPNLKRLAVAGNMPFVVNDFLWLFEGSRELDRIILLDTCVSLKLRRQMSNRRRRRRNADPAVVYECNDHRRESDKGPLTVVLAQGDYWWSSCWPLSRYIGIQPSDVQFVECDYAEQWSHTVVYPEGRYSSDGSLVPHFWFQTAPDGKIWTMGEGFEFTHERKPASRDIRAC